MAVLARTLTTQGEREVTVPGMGACQIECACRQACMKNNRAKDARSIALLGVVETPMKWAVDG